MSNVFLYGFDGTVTVATYAVITSTAFQPLYGRFSDIFGRRICFFVSSVAFGPGCLCLGCGLAGDDEYRAVWSRVDVFGALLLVVAISVQLVGLSLEGNELPWGSPVVVGALVVSVGLLALFAVVEARTRAIPVIPLRMLKGRLPVLMQISNVCAGLAAYAYLFMLPPFFQVVLLDSATTTGARLAIPSLVTPLGGLLAGIVMSRWGKPVWLVRTGAFLMLLGNALVTALQFQDSKYYAVSASTVYLIRSLGSVWGVAVTSAIAQTTLSLRPPEALGDVPNKWRLIDEIRHSVVALKTLPVEVRLPARHVYYEGIRYAFAASTAFAGIAVIAAICASPRSLRSTHE